MAKVAHTVVAKPTSTGNQDITISGFGTVTGFILAMCSGTVDGTTAAHARLSIGMSDTTNHMTGLITSRDNVGTTSTRRYFSDVTPPVALSLAIGTSNTEDEADFVSTITDGIRINWTTASANTYQLLAIFFDDSADMTSQDVTVATDLTGLAFEPNLVVTMGQREAYSIATSGVNFSLGGAANDGLDTNASVGLMDLNARGTSEASSRLDTASSVIHINSAGSLNDALSIGSFDANGYTVTPDTSTMPYAGLALGGFDGGFLKQIATPTSPGTQAITGCGVTPEWLLIIHSTLDVIDTGRSGGDRFTMGVTSVLAASEYSVGMSVRDGVGTSDTRSLYASDISILDSDSDAVLLQGTLTSFDSDGFTLNWTTVDPLARQLIVLGLGNMTAGSVPGFMRTYAARRR